MKITALLLATSICINAVAVASNTPPKLADAQMKVLQDVIQKEDAKCVAKGQVQLVKSVNGMATGRGDPATDPEYIAQEKAKEAEKARATTPARIRSSIRKFAPV
jgi:hypothetical protein